ncbi:Acyl-coenzyme A:6-aminopenicillanic acid acyl-transferase [Polystyrenella longa]|uniref:Acyl-coenzyme A:6-aminopenicillanic acid acyl-transferase n=1 Tax=Polystyrenella longa TaxID=2528007 RepID=A0A518CPR0_9PLAN|nr:C45 family peptidase [Polystyrenella longa]QDU81209.1 Acyl-coenzyme A:6-aminopenicillanic acid acyl-transferase [Polystyrenella longa]
MIASGTGSDYWSGKMSSPRLSSRRDALAEACVQFLSQKTGYPARLFDLDAALDDDYFIDGCMQIEMLIEVSKQFNLSSLVGLIKELPLGGSCSLRQILDFIQRKLSSERTYQNLDLRQQSESSIPDGFPIPVVELSGTPYEMGFQHGRNQAAQTKQVTRKVAKVLGPRLFDIPELNDAISDPTIFFGESEIEEIHGLADAMGISFPAALGHNLGLYPEYIPGCSQFAISEEANRGGRMLHCVNEDSPITMLIGSAMRRVLQLRNPKDGYRNLLYSIAGQVGGLNGINECGLTVSTTILLDRPRHPEISKGRIHPAIVKNILEKADSIESALAVFHDMDRNGAWSLCLSEASTGRICYLEYEGHDVFVRSNLSRLLSTNHSIMLPETGNRISHSEYRLQRLEDLLQWNEEEEVSLELAQASLRDRYDIQRERIPNHPTKNTVRRNDNQGSLVFAPQEGRLFITPGPMEPTRDDHYYELDLNQLLLQTSKEASLEEVVV